MDTYDLATMGQNSLDTYALSKLGYSYILEIDDVVQPVSSITSSGGGGGAPRKHILPQDLVTVERLESPRPPSPRLPDNYEVVKEVTVKVQVGDTWYEGKTISKKMDATASNVQIYLDLPKVKVSVD